MVIEFLNIELVIQIGWKWKKRKKSQVLPSGWIDGNKAFFMVAMRWLLCISTYGKKKKDEEKRKWGKWLCDQEEKKIKIKMREQGKVVCEENDKVIMRFVLWSSKEKKIENRTK